MRKMKDSGIAWIGEIPEEWKVVQLKRLTFLYSGKEIRNEIDKSVTSIPVYGSGGIFKYTDEYMYDGEAIMFGRKGTLGKPLYTKGKFWAVDTMYFLTVDKEVYSKYIYYQLIIFDWSSYITHTALPSIVGTEIISCRFAFPPLDEQRRIAAFLDDKCAHIDAVIEKTRASIDEYKKLKQAIITRAVTKGLRQGRKMKDSGIEWIGEICDDFSVRRLKFLLEEPLMYGANETGIPYDETLPRYIRITDITLDGKLKDAGKLSLTQEEAQPHLLNDGDILLARSGASVGKTFIYKKEYGISAFASYLIRARAKESICPKFIFYYTQSSLYEEWKQQIFIQSTIQNIGADRYSQLPIVLPPLPEQQEIASYLDAKTAAIDRLIAKKEQLAAEMENCKKSLIYEVVTGKREAAI